ncbi:angiopoietin-4-like [Asterias amurensis]|uniref:angiopoietin-4-like n=1 Tax=Asterias amurensis TaxID=7602 RepID=UPI003AB237AF
MHTTQWVSFVAAVIIASWYGFASVTAFSCSFGREPNPKENGIIRWVMPLNHRLRCQCTSIYPGGMNTYTPERGFDPFYTDHPLFTDLDFEIFNYFDCENCSLTCGNGGTFIDDPCHCLCAQNWTGKTCTKCALTGCENNGTLDEATCTCTCPKQWMGNTCTDTRHYDCRDYFDDGESGNRVYTIYTSKYPGGLEVNCRGRWIVIQRRNNKNLDFNLGWGDYKDGFGDVAGRNFWLGNEKIRQLTEDTSNTWTILVLCWLYGSDNTSLDRKIQNFRLLGENYTLQANDQISFEASESSSTILSANNMPFSTRDRDNRGDSNVNCAEELTGGWWFNGCSGEGTTREINLNGEYIDDGTNKGLKRPQCADNCPYIRRTRMAIRRNEIN